MGCIVPESVFSFPFSRFVDIEMATCGIFSIDELWNDCEGGRSSGDESC
jgi:hypothetical protein